MNSMQKSSKRNDSDEIKHERCFYVFFGSFQCIFYENPFISVEANVKFNVSEKSIATG